MPTTRTVASDRTGTRPGLIRMKVRRSITWSSRQLDQRGRPGRAGNGQMSMERLVSQRREVKAIQQGSSMEPRGESLSIHHRVYRTSQTWSLSFSPVRRIVVNSRWSTRGRWSKKVGPSRTLTACLVKPRAAWAEFLRSTWGIPQSGPPSSTCSQRQAPLSPIGHKVGHSDARERLELSSNQVIGRQ